MMDIVFASWVKTTLKWVLVALVLGFLGWALMWGIRELMKPCPVCQGKPTRCSSCCGQGVSPVTTVCPKCKGTGEARFYGKCSQCNGAKTYSYTVTCQVCNGHKTAKCPKCNK